VSEQCGVDYGLDLSDERIHTPHLKDDLRAGAEPWLWVLQEEVPVQIPLAALDRAILAGDGGPSPYPSGVIAAIALCPLEGSRRW
jgi:hypothetical protein